MVINRLIAWSPFPPTNLSTSILAQFRVYKMWPCSQFHCIHEKVFGLVVKIPPSHIRVWKTRIPGSPRISVGYAWPNPIISQLKVQKLKKEKQNTIMLWGVQASSRNYANPPESKVKSLRNNVVHSWGFHSKFKFARQAEKDACHNSMYQMKAC